MSISDGLCGVCGVLVETPNAAKMKSRNTGRLWCGRCNFSNRQQIVVWLYNEEKSLEIVQKDNTYVQKHVHNSVPTERPSWDDYYLGIAKSVSARGDCVRRQHGAVIVKNHKIVATGYNGAPSGSDKSCWATGECPRNLDPNAKHSQGEYDLCWATHAEANALLRASWEEMQGSTIYITGQPCPGCTKLINSAGIDRIVY
jgi:dCMP deaminase